SGDDVLLGRNAPDAAMSPGTHCHRTGDPGERGLERDLPLPRGLRRCALLAARCLMLALQPLMPGLPCAAPLVAPGYVSEHWSVADGLPVNSINSILQSRDGYLWLATFDGLVRFDGVRFQTVDNDSDQSTPSSRWISVHEGSDGSLWLSTEQHHLVRYKDGRFV